MPSLPSLLSARIEAVTGVDPELRPATKPQFGHFQSNVALRLANAEGRRPRDVATEIVAKLEIADLCEPPEIAGPGFLNFRLRTDVLASAVTDQLADPSVGIVPADHSETVVIDYSAPNVAKQMHVGNLRSTIIGDCLHRVLVGGRSPGDPAEPHRRLGHPVRHAGRADPAARAPTSPSLDLAGAEAVYQRANAHFKADPEFATAARRRVVALQSGDAGDPRRCGGSCSRSPRPGSTPRTPGSACCSPTPTWPGSRSTTTTWPRWSTELEESGIAVIDDGALCVFVDGFNAPMIVRKADGGYGYSTTDLAAVRHRVRELHADRIIYVVGAPQSFHFDQVFAVSRLAGFLPDDVRAEHVAFGQVLGADGKKFSTREGTAVTLNTLLDAAEEQAAPPIAMAAVKYADLSTGLNKDYVFDVARMVQTTGNTGPVPAVRPRPDDPGAAQGRRGGLRRADQGAGAGRAGRAGARPAAHPLRRGRRRGGRGPAAAQAVRVPLRPVRGAVGLLRAVPGAEVDRRRTRLAAGLCLATKRVLASGLNLLGIEALDRM